MKSIYSLLSSKQIPQYEVEVLAADAGWQTYKQHLEDGYTVDEAALAARNAYEYSSLNNPYSSGRRVDIIRKLEAFDSPFDDQADNLNRYRDPARFCGENLNLNDLFQTYELALGDTHRDLEMALRNTNALEHHQMPIWREIYDRICGYYPEVGDIPVTGTKDIRHVVHGCTSKFSSADIRYFLQSLQGKHHPMEHMRRLRLQYQVGYHLGWRLSETSLDMIEEAISM